MGHIALGRLTGRPLKSAGALRALANVALITVALALPVIVWAVMHGGCVTD